jgi:hypothetical protein
MSQDGAQVDVNDVESTFTLDKYKDLVDKVLEKDISSQEKLLELSAIISSAFASNVGLLLYQKWFKEPSHINQLELVGDCFLEKIKDLHETKEEDTQSVTLLILDYVKNNIFEQNNPQEDHRQWLNRCGKIMEYVYTTPRIKEKPSFILQIAEFLFKMHKILEKETENFTLMTFIWKVRNNSYYYWAS